MAKGYRMTFKEGGNTFKLQTVTGSYVQARKARGFYSKQNKTVRIKRVYDSSGMKQWGVYTGRKKR
jgi:hypothetical protein